MGSATSHPPQGAPTAPTSIKFSRDELDWLKQNARANHRSVSGQVRWMIARAREADELKEAA